MQTFPFPARYAARGFIFDEQDNLVLLRRIKPGKSVYYVTPGGKIEPYEGAVDALKREILEELDAEVIVGREVFQRLGHRFFVAFITAQGDNPFNGPEFTDERFGRYEIAPVSLAKATADRFDLQPKIVKEFLKEDGRAVMYELDRIRRDHRRGHLPA